MVPYHSPKISIEGRSPECSHKPVVVLGLSINLDLKRWVVLG